MVGSATNPAMFGAEAKAEEEFLGPVSLNVVSDGSIDGAALACETKG